MWGAWKPTSTAIPARAVNCASVWERGRRQDRRRARREVSNEFFHEGDQILAVERTAAIGARVEEAPHPAVIFQGVEEQLLLDHVLIQEGLIECTDSAFERIGDTKI